MAVEGTYEYECMRAELLGVEKPDYDEFMKNKAEKEAAEREALEAESVQELHTQEEGLQRVRGRFNELNSILKSTQRKLNILSAPFSKYLKSKMGTSDSTNNSTEDVSINAQPSEVKQSTESKVPAANGASGVCSKVTLKTNTDAIDDLIEKSERATISMEQQKIQMKRLLK